MSQEEIFSFLNELFQEERHIFNIPVQIETKDYTYETSIVTSNDTYLLTFNQEKINIRDIVSITRK